MFTGKPVSRHGMSRENLPLTRSVCKLGQFLVMARRVCILIGVVERAGDEEFDGMNSQQLVSLRCLSKVCGVSGGPRCMPTR